MSQTIQETIQQLHASLQDYIEATYHISAPSLIRQRQELLARPGVIHQVPYLESTPRYETGESFEQMKGLPDAALEVYTKLSAKEGKLPRLIYNPPYKHQSDSIRHSLIDGKNLVIMTGTGSGKTESFLLPILGKLAREAESNPSGFGEHPAMRAFILYPMNALVNDQLGRLRSLFGDPRLVELFKQWTGRPPRFARYTSRTPYAGMRTSTKDSAKLKSFDDFYVDIERRIKSGEADERADAIRLLQELKDHGKWPAKPDLAAWFGEKGSSWQNRNTTDFKRAVTLLDDSELLTRHEVQAAPPDLLVTNYSMLEYMLMRPIERPLFDQTRDWLIANPKEKFLVVLDEAHLYRGAAGAEVGLLLRRLRSRLGIPPERFQVICATASFEDKTYAPDFGTQLSGVPSETFVPITGTLDLRPHSKTGSEHDADILSAINLGKYYNAQSSDERIAVLKPFLNYRQVKGDYPPESALYHALKDFGPMGLLVNSTMKEALPLNELGHGIFPTSPLRKADAAVTSLMALGSIARLDSNTPGLLPCRIHNFFKGLPGLWVCMDPDCSELVDDLKDGICGQMFSQPIERCGCGSRVLELYTCRNCGTAYARAYTDDVDSPSTLWSEPGQRLRMAGRETGPLLALDLLLEEPSEGEGAEPADYDLETGRLNPPSLGPRTRRVFIRGERSLYTSDEDAETDTSHEACGEFKPCAICGKTASFGRTYVQDHQTKGDQPFQALVARQIQIQPPGPQEATRFAPLQGRKVLTFSDSRQVAARLAPNLQMYSVRDSLRPLIAWGFKRLQKVESLRNNLNLDDLYLAVLLASNELKVRLRPEMKSGENFDAELVVEKAIADGETEQDAGLLNLCLEIRNERPPAALLESMVTTIQDRFWGFEALGLASIVERHKHTSSLEELPSIPGVAETSEEKVDLARAWLRCWQNHGFWLNSMPGNWENRSSAEGVRVKTRNPKAKFKSMDRILADKAQRKIFWDQWSPTLLDLFTRNSSGSYKRLSGSELSLRFDGSWVHCHICKSVHRPVPNFTSCVDCGSPEAVMLDPDNDPVFLARKGFYRKSVVDALSDPPRKPMALIAAEHTAQLNASQNEDVFSKAEENELLFQDIALTGSSAAGRSSAIDVLSSTTTMEVGIDLGALSGVALRNMPPGRANYQQRAGRAGRRGNAVATVVAFGSADSHDEHYFSEPDGMIRGDVIDPRLTLENADIVCRHIRAFLLQNYLQDRLPEVNPKQQHDLFSVLGTVSDFRNSASILNRDDFSTWLSEHEVALHESVAAWIPDKLSVEDRKKLLSGMVEDCLNAIDDAIRPGPEETAQDEANEEEDQAEVGEERPRQAPNLGKLLDRLLYCGKLPRYAFPTDVATFHVFDRERSTRFRRIMRFAPSQGLPIALSQYAPGKQVWISGKCYTSGAIYSPMKEDREAAYASRRIYMECSGCGYAKIYSVGSIDRNSSQDCPACGGENTFGPARYWMRPPGFAHPVDVEEVTSPEDMPETSYATRAKLTMETPKEEDEWTQINDRIRILKVRKHLLVSNTGPGEEGYNYCTKCGRIEASSDPNPQLAMPHNTPFPTDENNKICDGTRTVRHLVLGSKFITDIALLSVRVAAPLKLKPAHSSTTVALRTVSEAIAKAACQLLEIEPGELMAEFRPALTPAGASGLEAEIFLYDTLPGGAGFASQLPEKGLELFQRTLTLMKTCPEDCDASCYRCLRSFKNKFEHSLLDRHVGVELLEYLLNGESPQFNPIRIRNSTLLLAHDLHRQSDGSMNIQTDAFVNTTNGPVSVPILVTMPEGRQLIIALSGPLTDGHPADPCISELLESGFEIPIHVENEMIVRSNLPFATRKAQQKIGR